MDFDDAKENIQPLATGRNASILQASLRVESPQELQAQRKELEQAIHNYDGDDPLEVWYDYVTWIEQSFPSGGKESGLEEVLTKCLTYFEHETRYHQDRRLIKLYIKFIDMHKNPTECYQQLVSEGIGTMVADLYISWAYCYDLCGNYKKANEIFRRGIACRAQPLEELQEAHQHFCFIVSQRFLYKDDVNETELANQELNERRLVLSSLRSHRKKVGSIRTGTAVKSYVPGTVQIDANTSTRRCNAPVTVFTDENQNPNFLLPSPVAVNDDKNPEEEKKSVTRCIIDATRDLENQKEPGPWNKAHDKKKGKLFTKNTTILGFNILEDNATTETAATSEKHVSTKEIVIEKPFKPFPNFVSKNRPQPDWPTPVTIENEAKPRSYPQYNKCKLYPRPNMELQLEELLAYNWFRKRGITNDFTQRRDAVWQNNNESIQPLRQYPNFAKSSRKQTANSLDNFCAPEKINAMTVNYNDIYNIAEKQEYQFEEILYKRWQNGERKLRYDANDTIIIATEMEETICMPQDVPTSNRRKSFFPARKSMFKKNAPQVQAMEAFVESADIDVPKLTNDAVLRTDSIVNSKQNTLPNFADEKKLQKSMENFKIYDEYYDAPSTSKAAAAAIKKDVAQEASSLTASKTSILPTAVLQNSFEFKAPAPPPTINIFNKIPFEIYTETEVDVPTTTENVGFFEADETCNTQAFTCFIKSHSVSTPIPTQKVAPRMFGTILKEKTEPEPIPEVLPSAFLLESNAEVATATGSTTSLSPVVTKQLSTILETSEHGTTKSISSPEYETDTKMSMGGRLGATTQHTTNLETVKEQSCEISTRSEQFLCKTLPAKNTSDIVIVNSSQVEPSSAATEAPRLASNYFAIFEDPTATALAYNKHVGNFSRLDEREDTTTAAGYVVRPIKFQEDKTETIPCIMYTSKQNVVKFQDDKTETLPKTFTPSLLKFEDEENADTLSKLPPIKLPEKIDDSFNFFTQTPPKFLKSINNQTSMLSTNELLGFDSENSPVSGGATAAKLKCNYNTPELREKMSFMRQHNDNSSFVPETQPTPPPKLSFMSDFSLIAETQPTTMQPKVLSFIKDSQPLLVSRSSSSKLRDQQAAALHDSFELPDFSIVMDSQPATQNVERKWKQNQSTRPLDISSVMDSQPTQNVATKWKQNQNTPPPPLEPKCKEHILTDSFMKGFSSIKDPLPESAFSKFFAEKPISNLSKLKLSENVQDKSMQKINTSEVAKAPLSTSALIDGNTTKNDVAVDNFIKPALAYGSSKKMHASPFAVNGKPTDELFEYNAETAQFATNLSMIRNSTLLSKETHKRQTQFQDKSLHIKDERQSQSGNSFDSSYKIFKSPPLPLAASSQARKSIAQKTSKISFLNAAATTLTAVAPAAELSSNSLRFSIDLSVDEVATLQMAKHQKNSSKQSASSFAIEFKTPTEKLEPKIIRIDSSEEIDEQHASDDADDYDNEMSIYVKHTPKTPKYQRHVWHNEPAQIEDEEGSNHFVHPECDLNQTQQCIENICSDGNVNPFNTDLINAFLEKVDFVNYIKQLPECELVGRVKQLHKDSIVKVNDTQFKVLKLIGEGSYGAIFCATECKTGKKYALKQERPANYWEYYICLELRSRLPVDELAAAFMIVDYALVGNNASILISQFSTYGSLIAVCNKIKKATMKNVDEYVVMHLTCQLLEIIDHLHATGIIHADIKADNFLLMEKLSYDRNHISLMLIDFGVSIDTRFFKNGQNFTFVHKDNAMKCIEMRENRPWTYQLDLYGLAGVIHVLLFGKYMDVERNANGFWMHKTHVPRYLKKLLWEKVFKSLLNVRNCAYTSMPNLQNLRTLLKEEIAENENGVIKKIFDFNRALES